MRLPLFGITSRNHALVRSSHTDDGCASNYSDLAVACSLGLAKRCIITCALPAAYRTVSAVNGPLVILDNVKVREHSRSTCHAQPVVLRHVRLPAVAHNHHDDQRKACAR